MEKIELTDIHLDALKEVASIGIAHAATALSQLAEKRISITVPKVRVVPLKEVSGLIGPPETLVAAICTRLLGEMEGMAMIIFLRDSALNLVDILMKRPPKYTKVLRSMDQSALKEAANIMIGSFVTALAEFLNISFMHGTPEMAFDMVGAILDLLAVKFGKKGDYIFCMQTQFIDVPTGIKGNFLLVLDEKALKLIIDKIEMKINEMKKREFD
jgi:chemotaxis protein CheC